MGPNDVALFSAHVNGTCRLGRDRATLIRVDAVSGAETLLADSGHMLGDVLGLAMAVAAIRFARRPATAGKTYGFYRAEILAALVNSIALILVAAWILYAAWQRLYETNTQDARVEALPMLVVARGASCISVSVSSTLSISGRRRGRLRGADPI